MRILLTNDDGVNAPGLKVLETIARTISDDVWIVAPASERKQGVSAVNRIGSALSSKICSRTLLVSDTSAVGMSQRPSVVWKLSSANFGSCPVPNSDS